MSDLPIPFDRNRRLPPEKLDDFQLPDDAPGELVTLADFDGGQAKLDPRTGDLLVDTDDGGVIVQIDPRPQRAEPLSDEEKFYANLADDLDDYQRGRIVEEVIQGVDADNQSRQDWLDMRAEGIKMLGLTLETATGDVGSSTGPFEGMSTVRHPLLLEAIARFQATAAAELYPPSGPVKVRDDRPSKPPAQQLQQAAAPDGADPDRDELAEALERGFNHNLTVVDRGYRPDSVRMLFWIAFGGCAFKKIYDCPIKRRPMSRFVDAKDIIVSNAVSDHRDAGRLTHQITMRPSLVRRMQIAGVYRDVELGEPQFEPNQIDEAVATAQGLQARAQRQEDQPRTLYESYVELDIAGLEHQEDGAPSGIPLPYKVTIDKDSRQILELRRNWETDDDTYAPRQVFVKFGFVPAMGFYDLGLLHLLGQGNKALTAAWREALDAGMYANFPGFLYNEGVIRNWTNQNRVPPGGGLGIKAPAGQKLDEIIRPLPYKAVDTGHVAFVEHVEQRMDRVAGTAELPVGEGRQDAPVGTTIALIEQATKVLAAVHIGLHASQAEEFELLKERYRRNPEAFWRGSRRLRQWEVDEFLAALDDAELVPAADPNTPSHLTRVMRAQAVKMVAAMNPQMYDMRKVDAWVFQSIGVSDPEQFFAPPPDPNAPPQMDPMLQATLATLAQKSQQAQQEGQIKIAALQQKSAEGAAEHQARLAELTAEAQAKERDRDAEAQQAALESADRAADRASEERRAALQAQGDLEEQAREHLHQRRQQAAQQGLAGSVPGVTHDAP